jgi:hypothetical protein
MWKLLLALLTVSAVSCSSSPPKAASANAQVKAAPSPTVVQPNPNEGLTPPEVVRSEEVRIEHILKYVTVGNAQGHYHLSCNAKLDSCITPVPGKDYFVFSKTTRWQFPGATKVATLKFFQDFSVTYNDQENVALVPSDGPFGMYTLDSWRKMERKE